MYYTFVFSVLKSGKIFDCDDILLYCVIFNVIERTVAGFPIKCGTDPVLALAAWTVKLPWIGSRAKADATLAFAPPTTDFALGRPAATQR